MSSQACPTLCVKHGYGITVKFLFHSHLSVASAPNPVLSEHMSLVQLEVTAFSILGTMSKTNECFRMS